MRFAMSLLSLRPGQVGGAETYVRQLVRWLPAVAGGDELALVMPREVAHTLETPGWRRVIADLSDRQLVMARVAEAFTPWRARGLERLFGNVDAVLFPQQSIFPKRIEAPAVLSVGDVQHLFHPRNIPLLERAFRAAAYPHGLRRARRIIAVSEYTKKTLVERAGVPPDKITAVPMGFTPAEAASVRPLEDPPGPYLYYPAATFAHKNHAALFRTYAALARQGAIDEPLVLTGARTGLWKKLARLVRELGMEGRIRHLGYLSQADVRRVYAGASAIVFPSLFEGFGLPVLEAVAFGKKVIVSRLEVFEEIGVPSQFRIDFSKADQLLAALRLPGTTQLAKAPLSWEENARKALGELRRAGISSDRA